MASRIEKLLRSILDGKSASIKPQSRVESLLTDISKKVEAGGFGGASSWNDLTDKPFGSENTTYAHVENVEVNLNGEGGSFCLSPTFGKTELPESVTSLVGASVSAMINGTQINGVLQEVTFYSSYYLENATRVAVGNLHLLDTTSDDLADTGEDWCISVGVGEYYPIDHAVAFTVYGRQMCDVTIETLTCFSENIKPLDPKYLPKATAVADVTEAPTVEQFNALLASLREAGYLAE